MSADTKLGKKDRSLVLPTKMRRDNLTDRNQERGSFVQIKETEDARGGVAAATPHKSRPQDDAELGEKDRSLVLPTKMRRDNLTDRNQERGFFIQIKEAEDARGGVAAATPHKSRPQDDAELGEKDRSLVPPTKMRRDNLTDRNQERGIFVQVKEAEDARGGVAAATPHKSRPQDDAELGEKDRSQGFTLLEVMIAIALLGIALVALLGLAQRTISTNERLQQITRATLLAQAKMAEIETGIESSDTVEGDFSAPDDAFHWRASYSETPVEGVRQVELTVSWGAEEKSEAVQLISFLQRGGAR